MTTFDPNLFAVYRERDKADGTDILSEALTVGFILPP
jgi:hypothetical protein